MAKAWYVVHTYSGYENKIERQIRVLIDNGSLSDYVFDIKVPAEDVIEIKDGKKKKASKKFLPGYILLEMNLPDKDWKTPCSIIKRIQGVTAFVGTLAGSKPQPISAEEAKGILQRAGQIKSEKLFVAKDSYEDGETIRIIEGPFNTFTGTIEEINTEKAKLKVMVGIFGRATPVEVDFAQVEKI